MLVGIFIRYFYFFSETFPMPSPRIRTDYDELAHIAQQFQAEADRTQQTLRQLQQTKTTLEAGDWLGQGASQFYQEMDRDIFPALMRLTKALEQAARVTGQARQVIHTAEGDAAAVFKLDGLGTAEGSAAGGGIGSGGGEGSGNSSATIDDPAMKGPWTQIRKFDVTSQVGHRSAQIYQKVIDQFDVEHSYSERYKKGTVNLNETRCNIFTGDVMRAMGVPLPTKGELGKGNKATGSEHTDQMTAVANDINEWLIDGRGEKAGWKKINTHNPADLALLQKHLAAGKPGLISMANSNGHGHMGVLRPDRLPPVITPSNVSQLRIAQAGGRRANNITWSEGFIGQRGDIFIHE